MADIKFMNLSENGNPATTDSVLIGNSQDGMKRTTLGTIGNMFAVHDALHFEEVQVAANTAAGQITDPAAQNWNVKYDIQAPDVPGYTFKCWIASQTTGFSAGNYVINKLANLGAQIWVVNAFTTALGDPNNSVSALAMYVKNELA